MTPVPNIGPHQDRYPVGGPAVPEHAANPVPGHRVGSPAADAHEVRATRMSRRFRIAGPPPAAGPSGDDPAGPGAP